MQFYAFDEQNRPVHADLAKKNFNYKCTQCGTRVRLRGGIHRRMHFFHLESIRTCALHQKGPVHLHLQSYLAETLPKDDCRLEFRFPAINRIADAAWLSKKIIFEIQCSPISPSEIRQRNLDYLSQGWHVIWILHDQRYNQKFLSPAEIFLRDRPHYFSNMNAKGEGVIYDQFEIIEHGMRRLKMPPLPVDLSHIYLMKEAIAADTDLSVCLNRIQKWPYYFKGDLIDVNRHLYRQNAREAEKRHLQMQFKRSILKTGKYLLNSLILHPYKVLFRYLLEKACK